MTYPVLYLFPRSDFASMNPGKAMAHTAHAANAFVHTMKKLITYDLGADNSVDNSRLIDAFDKWENATPQGFGTTIVLQGNWDDVLHATNTLSLEDEIHTGLSNDPTYPYVVSTEVANYIPLEFDTMPRHPGAPRQMVLYRSEVTCAWVFGMKDNPYLRSVLDKFNLHP